MTRKFKRTINKLLYVGTHFEVQIRQDLDANASATSNLNTYNYDSDIVCRLSQFQLVTEDTLHEVIMKCPSKSCSLDPMPTSPCFDANLNQNR